MFQFSGAALAAAATCGGHQFTGSSGSGAAGSRNAEMGSSSRPMVDTYRGMTDEELITLLQTREKQISQLRAIYENMHYECDKRFRTMIFDYHDKALQLSHVHGKMQLGSLQINREALKRMREHQEMANRDLKLMLAICLLATLCFWLWVRRHYVNPKESEEATLARSITGFGAKGNTFSSFKRSARSWETSWEREVRERKELESQQLPLHRGTTSS